MDPEGKLVMGFRKASNSISMQVAYFTRQVPNVMIIASVNLVVLPNTILIYFDDETK